MSTSLLSQRINTIIGTLFLGSFALGAILIVLNAADSSNPIAEAMLAQMTLPEE